MIPQPSRWRCVAAAALFSLIGGGCGGALFAQAPQAKTAIAVCSVAHALRAAALHTAPEEQRAADAWCAMAMQAAAQEQATLADRIRAAREASTSTDVPVPAAFQSDAPEPEQPDPDATPGAVILPNAAPAIVSEPSSAPATIGAMK